MGELDGDDLERLRVGLRNGPPLRLAILFGSRATNRARPDSDFDVGILPVSSALSLSDELALAASLSTCVRAEVDIIRLDSADPLLEREIARHGISLFEAEPGVFAAYRADAMSRWIDFEETIAPHRQRFLERLARSTR